RSNGSATQTNAPTSPTRRLPTVRVRLRSATGGGSAGPSTAWRANGRWRTASHNDCDAMRYRRPPTSRSNTFILSSSITGMPDVKKNRDIKASESYSVLRQLFMSAKVGLGDAAEWIRTIKEEHFPQALQILDLYHTRE